MQDAAPLAAICAVLDDYFDGLHFGDTARLQRAFHPQARYASATDGALRLLAMPEYWEVVAARASPALRGEPRADRIHGIDLVGPNAALARVGCRLGNRLYDDILSLIHVDGRWQIIAKVFDSTPIPANRDPCPTSTSRSPAKAPPVSRRPS